MAINEIGIPKDVKVHLESDQACLRAPARSPERLPGGRRVMRALRRPLASGDRPSVVATPP